MKKPLMVMIGALLLGGIGAATYILVSPAKLQAPSEVLVKEESPKLKLLSWDDPAGFTFSYPDGVVVDKHDEDQQNYAHIEMTHPDHKGNLVVWAKDLPAGVTDVVSWVKKDTQLAKGVSLDTSLGGSVAEKILVTTPEKRMIVGTVYDGLLFYVESTLTDDAYWESAINTVTGSFVFKPTETTAQSAPASSSNSSGYDDSVADEEEVLE